MAKTNVSTTTSAVARPFTRDALTESTIHNGHAKAEANIYTSLLTDTDRL